MTPTEQAARWLADVPKHKVVFRNGALCLPTGNWPDHALTPVVALPDAIAAIARHLAPGDDAVLIKKLMDGAEAYGPRHPFVAEDMAQAAARISALTATVAEAKADAEFLTKNRNEWQDACTVARNEAATLRDRLAGMEGAVAKIRGLIKYDLNPKSCEITASEDGEFVVYDHVSAALTDGGSNG